MKVGAHLTPTVHNICVSKGALKVAKIAIKMRKKKEGGEAGASAETKKEAPEVQPASAAAS